jgi:hypothetical protein
VIILINTTDPVLGQPILRCYGFEFYRLFYLKIYIIQLRCNAASIYQQNEGYAKSRKRSAVHIHNFDFKEKTHSKCNIVKKRIAHADISHLYEYQY